MSYNINMNSIEVTAKHTAYMKLYRASHPEYVEKSLKRGKVYQATHQEKIRSRHKEYRLAHKEEIKAQRSAHMKWLRSEHPEIVKAREIKSRYGLTKVEFNYLLSKQGGVCAVCKKPNWNGRGPMVDHDHKSGKVRGLLCVKCNVAIGMVDDDAKIARDLANYLATWTEE